jgi:streptomycin 6-kinase
VSHERGRDGPAYRGPELDDQLRHRLRRRFGDPVDSWLDGLPPVLAGVAERWQIVLDSVVQRGSMSVVMRCRTGDGRPAVLKTSPDRSRILAEAAALSRWSTRHVPEVLAVDDVSGALLMEAVVPGTPLADSVLHPSPERLGSLVQALHAEPTNDVVARPVVERVAYLFEAGRRNYERRPDLASSVPPELYERGRRLAMRLASEARPPVLLHGDLTSVNVLDGGEERGWVAIDPAPCLGDAAFDAVDLVLWRGEDAQTVTERAEATATALGVDARRVARWCAAFSAMAALEAAESGKDGREQVELLLELARAET